MIDACAPSSDAWEGEHRVVWYDEAASTNDLAFEAAETGTVIVADGQTAGRGRLGRSWESRKGLGLWFSIAFDGLVEGLTFAAALAIRDALEHACPLTIKWPNDLLAKGRKVCGILVEHRQGRTVLGVGLNVLNGPGDFSPDLVGKATSLKIETGLEFGLRELLGGILTGLDEKVKLLERGGYEEILAEWSEACAIVGRRVRSGDVSGLVVDLDGRGALVIDTDQGLRTLYSGEIVVLEAESSNSER